nr:immunoglobulin light chain junction region [Macaca mulatta]
CQKYASTPFTF